MSVRLAVSNGSRFAAGMARDERRPAVLVIAPTRDLTFVARDIAILSRTYRVDVLARHDYLSLRQFIPALLRQLRSTRYSLVYVWFAEPYDSPHTVIAARLLGIKCAIVVGGYEVASLPELHYGGMLSRRGRWKVRFALRFADALFPTSDFLAEEVRKLGRHRGVKVIYLGVDCAQFVPGNARERLVVTAGTVGQKTSRLKGLDVFARCSRLLPDVQFVVLGPSKEEEVVRSLRSQGGPNLTLSQRFVAPHEMASWFRRASVYAQLSARESFGLALAEAMASGCVPVAAATGFMPAIVGETGFLVEYGNVEAAAESIERGLAGNGGAQARARIQALFPLERREQELSRSVEQLVSAS